MATRTSIFPVEVQKSSVMRVLLRSDREAWMRSTIPGGSRHFSLASTDIAIVVVVTKIIVFFGKARGGEETPETRNLSCQGLRAKLRVSSQKSTDSSDSLIER